MGTDLEIEAPRHAHQSVVKKTSPIRVGLLGCGAVGTEVARELLGPRSDVGGCSLAGVAVAHLDKKRKVELPSAILTGDAFSLVKDPTIDVIVELIGGLELPHALLRQALVEGKSVVTANKEVVALHGQELLDLADERKVGFHFEGSVGGAIPAVRTVAEYLSGDRIESLVGILNGTSNFVLTQVSSNGLSPEAATELAKTKGYAEQDPSEDINGTDAARKAAILGWLAFGRHIDPKDVFVRGIESLSADDVHAARRLGFITKLVVRVAESSGFVRASVEPEAIPGSDALASVDGSQNQIVIRTNLAGDLSLGGPGAGGPETASAVLGDIQRARRRAPSVRPRRREKIPRVLSRSEPPGRYLVRCRVTNIDIEDRIRGCLFGHGIGIDRVERFGVKDTKEIVMLTEHTDRGCIGRALKPLEDSGVVSHSVLKIGGVREA